MNTSTLLELLTTVVGKHNVALTDSQTEYYRTGFRSGSGSALAVIFPETLLQQWQVLQHCTDAKVIMIMQAANTGLTEGSTPNGDDYDRDIVIINTTRMNKLILLNHGEQVLSFPGSTLHQLEQALKPLQRAPHSVIGSSCLGASIVGGIANNSGGALVKRGPAYTELSLYAQITAEGKLVLVNELDIPLGNTPEEILSNLENERFAVNDVKPSAKLASDQEYTERLRDTTANTPSRYNADKRRLYGASGCAGKVAVFAVRLDTFALSQKETVFYIGTNDPAQLTTLRQDILQNFTHLPEVVEYMHREAFDIAEQYGKDVTIMIDRLGTRHLPKLFAIKGRITSTFNKLSIFPNNLPDRFLQWASRFFPNPLPDRLRTFRDRYEHHLILKVSDEGIEEALQYFYYSPIFGDKSGGKNNGKDNGDGKNITNDYFICNEEEAKKALLHRFAAAGAAVRYQVVHDKTVEDILALDIALPRNCQEWMEVLPDDIQSKLLSKLYYGHFLCHVFHQDYIVKKGVDVALLKKNILAELNKKQAKYPAEHNVGHLYQAEDSLRRFYQELDPTNSFNPGVGKLPKQRTCC
ncbi:D-Lactate dehydrogenase [gamma proteobacterium IMCC1989]|nr:D-Lactate dehydrogenase [gamma proteobacterium IMCC1989]